MLPAAQRLRRPQDFRAVYRRGRSYTDETVVLYVLRRSNAADCPQCRVGFVVSKKQGKAARRNRMKRRLREAVRLLLPRLRAEGCDLVFVARSRLDRAEWPQAQSAVAGLLRRAGLLTSEKAGDER